MKKIALLVMTALLLLVVGGCSGDNDNTITVAGKDITLVTQVVDKGEVGVAIIIAYDEEIVSNELNASDISVFVGNKSRTIKTIYTSEKAEVGKPTDKGKYVVAELNAADENASTLTFDIEKFVNTRSNLDYTVKQNNPISTSNDKEYAPTKALPIDTISSPDVDAFEKVIFKDGSKEMPYRLYTPESEDSAATKKPLVIYLHGSGERGTDNMLQLLGTDGPVTFSNLSVQATTPSYVLAPQIPWDTERNGWFADEHTKTVKKIVDDLMKEHTDIDVSRIYITGVSNGGTGTWKMLAEYPNLFAAAVPIAGYMYDKDASFVMDGTARYMEPNKASASKMRNIPIWTFQAEDDPVNSIKGSLEAVQAIKDSGGKMVKITEYPAGLVAPNPHVSWEKAYNSTQMMSWLMSQHR
ncbi:peptidase [Listeria booriae]|uniref:Peptidase n=2 Tax=Listeria booriae TaxID=1552123 RepID=A0A099W0R4_9LIST|nr:peptidase [Listeria booriae]